MEYNMSMSQNFEETTREANVRYLICVQYDLRRGVAAVRELRVEGMCLARSYSIIPPR
jgi:hypothetical protein